MQPTNGLRPGREIVVEVLNSAEPSFASRIVDVGHCRFKALTQHRIQSGLPVRISCDNSLYLGTVIHTASEEIIVEIEHMLRDMGQLDRQCAEWQNAPITPAKAIA